MRRRVSAVGQASQCACFPGRIESNREGIILDPSQQVKDKESDGSEWALPADLGRLTLIGRETWIIPRPVNWASLSANPRRPSRPLFSFNLSPSATPLPRLAYCKIPEPESRHLEPTGPDSLARDRAEVATSPSKAVKSLLLVSSSYKSGWIEALLSTLNRPYTSQN